MSLEEYRKKRDFDQTAEPKGEEPARSTGNQFVIQKHAASQLHYDFRLELDGVLKSWAMPKGPCLDPDVKALAIRVEDHPLAYATFEGIIPQGEYGGGTVMVWDRGEWTPEGDAATGLETGKLKFTLQGKKLAGGWSLVQMKGRKNADGKNWLLIKRDDRAATSQSEYEISKEMPLSVLTGRTLDQIANDADKVWSSHREPDIPSKTRKKPASKTQSQSKREKPPADPSQLTNATQAALPRDFTPQLATSTDRIPTGDDWLHELKFDGYRLLCFIEEDTVRLVTRRGNDWTERFPAIARALGQLEIPGSLLDGEVVALDQRGVSDFQRLQQRAKNGKQDQLTFYAFDAPFFSGFDLRQTPLIDRKELLARHLVSHFPANDGIVRYSDHIRGSGTNVLQQTCQHALEGVISKRADSVYENRRSRSWLKSKCQGRQEFVIGGFTKPLGSRTNFGALLLGYRSGDDWIYCGRVGTGFTQQTLRQLGKQLRSLKRSTPAFRDPPAGAQARGVTWVEPELVAEIEFSEWTDDGLLRHPSFQGLREDKSAMEVFKEEDPANLPAAAPSPSRTSTAMNGQLKSTVKQNQVAGIALSNSDRVLYPDHGVTKYQLAEYYQTVVDEILPHVVDRPLTLVRCPQGRGNKCFYQKHWTAALPEAVESVLIREKEGNEPYVVIRDLAGLISLVQMSTLELHPWASRVDRLERPDQIVFDLDPGEGVRFSQTIAAAQDIRSVLTEAELTSFVRTSGGKGLHVVVPITRRNSWEEVADFARNTATGMAKLAPRKYVANMRKSLRTGRIFIDYLRNRRGATSVASFSTRARKGAPVATPISWEELPDLPAADHWTIATVPERLAHLSSDPWEDFVAIRQSVTQTAIGIVKELSSANH